MGDYDDDPGHDINDRLWIQGAAVMIGVILLVLLTNQAPDWLMWTVLLGGFGVVGVMLHRRIKGR